MQLSAQQQKNRADMAENIEQYASMFPGLTKEHLGSHGHSQFAKKLEYILPANFFLVPFAHALLYGLLKDFWGVLLPPKIGKARLSQHRLIMHKFKAAPSISILLASISS